MSPVPLPDRASLPSHRRSDCVLFAGPTLYGPTSDPIVLPAGVRLLPPAQRGDVAALTSSAPPGVIVLADGRFHHCLAVGHSELREAVRKGWNVWGLSSMGAIRAYELRFLGMRGFGKVYARFEQEADFQDDEVALLHEMEPPYRALSEPLVHLRAALEDLHAADLLAAPDRSELELHLKSLWYGDRTMALFRALTLDRAAVRCEALKRLDAFDRYRIKSEDLRWFLGEEVWRRA